MHLVLIHPYCASLMLITIFKVKPTLLHFHLIPFSLLLLVIPIAIDLHFHISFSAALLAPLFHPISL